jgi:hypothetical protein
LNGRRIRNVLNIAEGYAFNEFGEPGMMKLSHVQTAVKAALEFQKFFDKAREKSRSDNSVWARIMGNVIQIEKQTTYIEPNIRGLQEQQPSSITPSTAAANPLLIHFSCANKL